MKWDQVGQVGHGISTSRAWYFHSPGYVCIKVVPKFMFEGNSQRVCVCAADAKVCFFYLAVNNATKLCDTQ